MPDAECEHEWNLPVHSMANGFDLLNNTEMHPKTDEHLWWCCRCGGVSWRGTTWTPASWEAAKHILDPKERSDA